MAIRKASNSGLEGSIYKDASAKTSKIADLPDAPQLGTVTVSAVTATIPFTASQTGGVATGFTAVSDPAGFTGTSSTSPITISGLNNATNYTFTVYPTNSSGNGKSTAASNSIYAFRPAPSTVSYLVVGGGAAPRSGAGGGGGGGGGTQINETFAVSASTSYPISIGAGGAFVGGSGSSTTGFDATAGGGSPSASGNASAGGSSGSPQNRAGAGSQANDNSNSIFYGGGGGGAGQVGQGMSGGSGNQYNGTYYGGGGGAGGFNYYGGASAGAGGAGGGGNGGSVGQLSYATYSGGGASPGAANTGGGGGGGYGTNNTPDQRPGKPGGSGVVIVRYPDSNADLVSIGAGLVYTKTTSGGYVEYKFTSGSGNVSW